MRCPLTASTVDFSIKPIPSNVHPIFIFLCPPPPPPCIVASVTPVYALTPASPRKRGRVGFADSVQDKPSRGDNAKGGAVAPPSPYESFITGRFAGSKFAVGVSLLGIHMMVSG